jgi:hypothetical protein
MVDNARTNEPAADDAAAQTERLPWTAPRMDTYEVEDTAASTPRTPGTDGSFTLS